MSKYVTNAAAAVLQDTAYVHGRCPTPSNARLMAAALERRGLLARTVPKPDYDREDHAFKSTYEADFPGEAVPDIWNLPLPVATACGVFPGDTGVHVWDNGHPMEPLSADDAERMGLALLAAAAAARDERRQR